MERLLHANSSEPATKRPTLDLLSTIAQLCERDGGFVTVRDRGVLHISRVDSTGFKIKIYDGGGPTAVVFGPWYGEVCGEKAILALVEKAMTGGVRIRIESCRSRDHSWTAEIRTDAGSWTAIRENRIAELWPLHATHVRYLSMPSSVDLKQVSRPARVAQPDPAIRHERTAMPYHIFAQYGSRARASSRSMALQAQA